MGKRLLLAVVLAAVAAAAGVVLRHDLPAFGDAGRGYGDTVLRYRDRTYDGAKWQAVQEARSLAAVAAVGDVSAVKLHAVTGWDADHLWVATDGGRVFALQAGQWQYWGRPELASYPAVRCLDSRTLFAAGGDTDRNRLYRLGTGGVQDLGEVGFTNTDRHTEILPVAADLLYCYRGELPHLNEHGTIRIANGQRTAMPEHKFKEAFVHTADNTPLKEYPVRALRFTRAYRGGSAVGLANCLRGVLFDRYKLVQFRDGLWYELADVGDHARLASGERVTAAWMTGTVDRPVAVLAGRDGTVRVCGPGRPETVQVVAPPAFATSLDLVAVWGVTPEKYLSLTAL